MKVFKGKMSSTGVAPGFIDGEMVANPAPVINNDFREWINKMFMNFAGKEVVVSVDEVSPTANTTLISFGKDNSKGNL